MTTLNEIVVANAGDLVANRVFLYSVAKQTPPTAFPYLTTFEDIIPRQVAIEGDDRTLAWSEVGQVSLWQRVGAESDTLLDDVLRALDGAKPASGPFMRLRVQSTVKIVEGPLAGDVVQDAITLRAARLR